MSEASSKTTTSVRRLGVDVQGRMDDYVARFDAALIRKNAPAAERRAQVVALRGRILEQLSARAPQRNATGADLTAVLADLGEPDVLVGAPAAAAASSPTSRSAAAAPAGAVRPRHRGPAKLSLAAVAGAIWGALFFLMLILWSVKVDVALKPGEGTPIWQSVLNFVIWPIGLAAPFATTVLGLLALGQIQRSNGAKYGLSLALFDALLFPLLLLDGMLVWVFRQVAAALIRQDVFSPSVADALAGQMLPIVTCILLDYYIATRSWAAVQPEESQ